MKKHAFDQEIKNKVFNATAPVPDDMWERIAGQSKKKRPFLLPWWAGALASGVLLTAFVAVYLQVYEPAPESNETETIAATSDNAADNQATSYTDNREGAEGIDAQKRAGDLTVNQTNTTESAAAESTIELDAMTEQTTIVRSTRDNDTYLTQVDAVSKVEEASGERSVKSVDGVSNNDVATSTSTGMASNLVLKGLDQMADDGNAENTTRSEVFSTSNEGLYLRNSEAVSLLKTANSNSMVQVDGANLTYDPCMVQTNVECYSFEPAKKKLYFEFMGGPMYHASFLRAKGDEGEALADLRESSENYLFSYTVGARASYILGNGLALRGGLSFTSLTEKFSLSMEGVERRRISQIIVDTIPIAPDLLRITRDTIWVTERGNRNIEHPNKYRFVDIPLMIGYEIENKDFVLGINGGVMFNLALIQKGRTVDATQMPVYLNNQEDDQQAYKSSVGMSLVASINAGYKLTDEIQVFVEPQLRYFMKPLTTSNYSLDHEVFTAAMQFGIRMAIDQ